MGRKSEVIVSACGQYRQRVFKGQRWMVVGQKDEASPLLITCFNDQATAERVSTDCYRMGYEVHFVTPAAPETATGGAA